MAITNLFAKCAWDQARSNLPVLILMHGFTNDVTDFTDAMMRTLANAGVFACAVGMRGRSSAGGSADCSGREIYDIYDALVYVRQKYASWVSPTVAAIWGGSGGGGNALAAACKFPDAWSMVISHTGISDYGVDGTYGWYQEEPTRQATLTTWVGGTPDTAPNNYAARNALSAIANNYTAGHLLLIHNPTDTAVHVDHSQRVAAAMLAAGRTNYAASYSESYVHAGLLDGSESLWLTDLVAGTYPAWTIEAAGTKTVIGSMETKRFSIRLNTNGTASFGIDATATVAYNTATDTYTVTPLTGALDVAITQGAKSGSAANITEATEIVVS